MTALITLPTDPRTIPGVESVSVNNCQMIVKFLDGNAITIERSPLARFLDHDTFDIYFPREKPITTFNANVAPCKSPEEVIAMLYELAAVAARQLNRE